MRSSPASGCVELLLAPALLRDRMRRPAPANSSTRAVRRAASERRLVSPERGSARTQRADLLVGGGVPVDVDGARGGVREHVAGQVPGGSSSMPSGATTRSHAAFHASTSPKARRRTPAWSRARRAGGGCRARSSSASGVPSGTARGSVPSAPAWPGACARSSLSRSATGQRGQHRRRRVGVAALLEPDEVVDAHAGQRGHLLAAEPGRPPAAVVGQPDVGGTQLLAARPEERAQVGFAHRTSMPRRPPASLAPPLPGCPPGPGLPAARMRRSAP